MMRLVWSLSFLLLVSTTWAAPRLVPADQPVQVKLELNQPSVIVLPEPIKGLFNAWAKESFEVDKNGPYLALILKEATLTGWLYVVGQSDTLYEIGFKVGTPVDRRVHLTSTKQTQQASAPPCLLGCFLRTVLRNTPLPGLEPVEVPLPTPSDARVAITEGPAVRLGRQIAQVLTVQNTQPEPLTLDERVGFVGVRAPDAVDLTAWAWPPLLSLDGLYAEARQILPGQTTRLLILYGRREPR